MDDELPSWLKAVQNGSLGEARARAFLLNRFWVLERSVDIDGADLLIQRRFIGKTLLDPIPPRLGVIQVKFFGSPNTTHYVHKRYVLDVADKPQSEFFLLCFFGDEDNQRISLVGADDIADNFPSITVDGVEKYRISFSSVADDKHVLTSIGSGLGRIERALVNADFKANRRFLSRALPSVTADLEAIEPDYHEPIGNNYGDLPKGFADIKRVARDAMFDIEEVYDLFVSLCLETNPLKAEEIVEEIANNCRSGMYNHWSITLPGNLYDEDFFNTCRRHKRIIEILTNHNVLDAYLGLKAKITSAFFDKIKNQLPLQKNLVCEAHIDYELSSFRFINLEMKFFNEEDYFEKIDDSDIFAFPDCEGINGITESKIELYLMPSRFGGIEYQNTDELYEQYLKYNFSVFSDCMNKIFEMRFGIELD